MGVDAVAPDDVWFPGMVAGTGDSSTLRWNGHTFEATAQLPQTPPDTLRMLSDASFDSAADGWMLYRYIYQSVPGSPSIAPSPTIATRWHDGRWTVTPMAISPDPQEGTAHPDAVVAASPDDAWAVGAWGPSTVDAGVLTEHAVGALTEHWDGTRWALVPNPDSALQDAQMEAITVVSPADIWAVGEQDNSSATGSIPLVEHWDDSTWNVVGGLPDIGPIGTTAGVYAASPDDVWVTFPGPRSFLHWDGSTWSAVPVPATAEFGATNFLAGISGTGPGDVWAVGFIIETADAASLDPFLEQVYHLGCGHRAMPRQPR